MKRSGSGEEFDNYIKENENFERGSKRITIAIIALYIINLIILLVWVLNVV